MSGVMEEGKEGAHHGKRHFDALFECEITPSPFALSPSPAFFFFFFFLLHPCYPRLYHPFLFLFISSLVPGEYDQSIS